MSEKPGLSHAIRKALLTGEASGKVFAARQVARDAAHRVTIGYDGS